MIGAAGNAYAVVLQHQAVESTVAGEHDATMTWRRMLQLARTPSWWRGVVVVALAAAVHITALVLAPISIVQPVGIVAVIFAIIFASRLRQSWPGRRVWAGAFLTIFSLGAFVVVTTTAVTDTRHVPEQEIITAAAVLLVIASLCAAVGTKARGWLRCLAWAASCSVVFGLASSLLRSASLAIRAQTRWDSPIMISLAVGLIICYAVGGWLAQQAYASGPPEIVMSSLTVLDPLVAVGFGLAVLGEGSSVNHWEAIGMAAASAVAVLGVVMVAKFHPHARSSRGETRSAG